MAVDTPESYRSLVVYSIYVRNHGPNGNFADVEADLERIRSLGVDIIWFMPIHPIGVKSRKGIMGSPYAIADYRGVNPEYGTAEDFARVIKRAHDLGMKVMIDVVYNHTSPDSVLVQQHPDWYNQDVEGVPVTTVPAWSDVIDLKYPNPDLEAYLIESLEGWVRFGVDGFRCDVASIVSVDFWIRAREHVAKINPDTIWLAESVHASFLGSRREVNLSAFSDSEIYRAFDMCYDYDLWSIWQAVVTGQAPVSRYLEILRLQNCIYPTNFVKMRCVENHDQARIMHLAPSRNHALAWTAFQAFNKGSFLIYGGQESGIQHTPSLFEIDKVEWGSYELQLFITRLAKLKKDPAVQNSNFSVILPEPVIVAAWEPKGNAKVAPCLLGVFNVDQSKGRVSIPLPDGEYEDLLTDDTVTVHLGQTVIPETAYILRYNTPIHPQWFYSQLLDVNIPPDQP